MNSWEFFNNLMFGFITGLTLGFFQSSRYTNTDQPAYVTAWHVGAIAGWTITLSTFFYLISMGPLT